MLPREGDVWTKAKRGWGWVGKEENKEEDLATKLEREKITQCWDVFDLQRKTKFIDQA